MIPKVNPAKDKLQIPIEKQKRLLPCFSLRSKGKRHAVAFPIKKAPNHWIVISKDWWSVLDHDDFVAAYTPINEEGRDAWWRAQQAQVKAMHE
jgi:hypothetical protein